MYHTVYEPAFCDYCGKVDEVDNGDYSIYSYMWFCSPKCKQLYVKKGCDINGHFISSEEVQTYVDECNKNWHKVKKERWKKEKLI
jgi:hypothetical protein